MVDRQGVRGPGGTRESGRVGDQGGKWRGARGPQVVLPDLASTRVLLCLGPWEGLRTTITSNTARSRPERGDYPRTLQESLDLPLFFPPFDSPPPSLPSLFFSALPPAPPPLGEFRSPSLTSQVPRLLPPPSASSPFLPAGPPPHWRPVASFPASQCARSSQGLGGLPEFCLVPQPLLCLPNPFPPAPLTGARHPSSPLGSGHSVNSFPPCVLAPLS